MQSSHCVRKLQNVHLCVWLHNKGFPPTHCVLFIFLFLNLDALMGEEMKSTAMTKCQMGTEEWKKVWSTRKPRNHRGPFPCSNTCSVWGKMLFFPFESYASLISFECCVCEQRIPAANLDIDCFPHKGYSKIPWMIFTVIFVWLCHGKHENR